MGARDHWASGSKELLLSGGVDCGQLPAGDLAAPGGRRAPPPAVQPARLSTVTKGPFIRHMPCEHLK